MVEYQKREIAVALPTGTNYVGKTYNEFIDMAKNKTQIIKDSGLTGSGTVDIYTVTANKTLYITSAWISIENNNGSGSNVELRIGTGPGGIFFGCKAGSTITADHTRSGNNAGCFLMPLKATSAQKIQAICGGGTATSTYIYGFTGWEE